VAELHPEVDGVHLGAQPGMAVPHEHGSAAAAIAHVKEELGEAEEFREHEALATAEGMPSGELDEDAPPANARSTSAGE